MNPQIRDWIERTFQPWRASPESSFLRGTIGSENSFALNKEALSYFERSGVQLEGRLYEDVLESELLGIYETLSAWLSSEERRLVDRMVAFGAANTHDPTPRATPYLDGYAILFDYGLDTLLISAVELYHACELTPALITLDALRRGLNYAICSSFFQRADYWTPIPDDGFEHRELTDSWIWLMSVFLVAHEIGHVVRGHFVDAPAETVQLSIGSAQRSTPVVDLEYQKEFEADEYAVSLLFRGESAGGLIGVGVDRQRFWNEAYLTLGWFFSVLAAVEVLGRRLGCALDDSHPPADERWSRVAASIRERVAVDGDALAIEDRMHVVATTAAESGQLPPIRRDPIGHSSDFVQVPYSAELAQYLRLHAGTDASWTPPSQAVLLAWINADTLEQARDVVVRCPELLHPNVDELHRQLAQQQIYDVQRAHILKKRLPLLQRSREIGVDAACEELRSGALPIDELPTFDVALDDLEALSVCLKDGDARRLDALFKARPNLAAFSRLPQTVMLLVNSESASAAASALFNHPELLHPTTDKVFADLAAGQTNEAAWRKVQGFRIIAARYRDFGLSPTDGTPQVVPVPARVTIEELQLTTSTGEAVSALCATGALAESTDLVRWPLLRFSTTNQHSPGELLDVAAFNDVRSQHIVAFGTPAGFLWCAPLAYASTPHAVADASASAD